MTASFLSRLQERFDIVPVSADPEAAVRRVLTALNLPVGTEEEAAASWQDLEREDWVAPLPPVHVCRQGSPFAVSLSLPMDVSEASLALTEECGKTHDLLFDAAEAKKTDETTVDGKLYARYHLPLPADLQPGYHHLSVHDTSCSLIVAPERCYFPLEDADRIWGVPLQLYGLRSRKNMGVGDFTDLAALGKMLAGKGADVIGINPIHAMYPDQPEAASPYTPASRSYLNFIYIDVAAVPDFADAPDARALFEAPETQEILTALRQAPMIDYTQTTFLKRRLLRLCFNHFYEAELLKQTDRAADFNHYRTEGGADLEGLAIFYALSAYFAESGIPSLHDWPEIYKKPDSDAVKAFAKEYEADVLFQIYLQWETERQLKEATNACGDMKIGLYLDLAVGVPLHSPEAWADPERFLPEMHVGVQDWGGDGGQNWQLAVPNPRTLRARAYAPYIHMLRQAMRHTGALRIDHVYQLQRLFVFSSEDSPAQGAYLGYPVEDLMAITALESYRNQCLVIGEDIGFEPNNFRPNASDHGFMSSRNMHDMRQGRRYDDPDAYIHNSVLMSSTHDCSPLAGLWSNSYVREMEFCGLIRDPAHRRAVHESGVLDRTELNDVLCRTGAWEKAGAEAPADPALQTFPVPAALSPAVAAYLAQSPAFAVLMNLPDLLGSHYAVNIPGTTERATSIGDGEQLAYADRSFPNWRIKEPLFLEEMADHPVLNDVAAQLSDRKA